MESARLIPLLLLSPLLCTGQEANPGCFVDGQCTSSLFVDEWPSDDAQECLEHCQTDKDCQFFTQYDLDSRCVGFANCEEFETDSCQQCYTGEVLCQDLVCWERGVCTGNLISIETASRGEDCHDLCRTQLECAWFTYNEADLSCILLMDCTDVDYEDCVTCLSGQKQCGERKDLSKFLVIGGYSYRVGGVIDTVEVVDLSSDNLSCSPVANYPRAQDVAAGNIVEGRPRVCGGSGGTTDLCFEYNYEENQWEGVDSLITPLSSLGGSLVNSATWLLSGGYTGDDYVSLTQVRGLDDDEFRSGPTMPRIFSRHCQVTVDPNTVMVLGGYNGTDYDPTVYNLDLVDENWVIMPELPWTIYGDSCGLIENSANGKEIVVLKDSDNCQIFNIENNVWREGPRLPLKGLTYGASVAQLNKNFVIFGGEVVEDDISVQTDAIFEFDEEEYEWLRKFPTLSTPKRFSTVIPVPDYMVDCD